MIDHLIDKAIVINLPHRTDRLEEIKREFALNKMKEPEVFTAHKDDNGAKGAFMTFMDVFHYCFVQQFNRVAIFEDDAQFVVNTEILSKTVEGALNDLNGKSFDIIYLGVNTHQPFEKFEGKNILKVNNGFALHGAIYSKEGIVKILKKISPVWENKPIDVLIAEHIQSENKCYCTYPLLVTQRPSYSDIEEDDVNYDYIEYRFRDNVKHLIE